MGGEEAFTNYIQETITYPKKAKKKGIEGKVIIKFIIDTDGRVKNAYILQGIGGGCDEEALRAVQLMPPWTPGMIDGQPAQIEYKLPVDFFLY